MNKKKKKTISQKRSQAKVRKQKRTQNKSQRSTPSDVQHIERPPISAIEAPPGFRTVSMSQGLLEYARPLLDFVDKGIVKYPDDIIQFAMFLWNYDISVERGDVTVDKQDMIKQFQKTLKISAEECIEFFEMMIQRKENLFPKDIQPDNPMIMFIKKEQHYLIAEFNYDSLNISEEILTPTNEDKKLIQLINQIDEYIFEGTEYDDWEEHYFEMEEKCTKRFRSWLKFKGVQRYSDDFANNVAIYLNFIYRYGHEDDLTLQTVTSIYIEEFFVDHVLRKVIAEPHEYTLWPPALKLFYVFLNEIDYLERPEKVIKLIDKIEPMFIEILKKRFS